MEKNDQVSRTKFLQQMAMLGAASIVAPFASKAENFIQPAKKIRIGLIGCGSVSTQYLPHLSKSEYVRLVSTCDIIPERAAKAAEKYKIPNHYPSIEKMLAGSRFDLMVNLTDMQEHGRLNKIVLEAGKHVWSEKPMATTYREGKELLELAKKKGKRIWGAPAVVNSRTRITGNGKKNLVRISFQMACCKNDLVIIYRKDAKAQSDFKTSKRVCADLRSLRRVLTLVTTKSQV